ncbi:MAG: flippase-like domain-containing protein [Actinomyces sp.]|nr:flippase-like domain-containing protein [Actinomyces sp.]
MPLVAFSTEKVRLRDAVLAQIAASIVTVVAPAGIGPAALNLRFLNKQKVPTAMAATTVTLMQISQFLTTILLLLIIILTSGSPLGVSLPYTAILAVAAVLVIVVVVLVATPRLRTWIWQKVQPTWVQVYPRVLWLVGQPRRILAVLGGNLLMNVGFIGSFAASLAAFGGRLDLMALSVTYLASNSLGSVVPSPGGIGPVEAALTGGLQVAGVPLSIALSTAVVYRLVTFYGRIPFGWVAMKVMQKRDLL